MARLGIDAELEFLADLTGAYHVDALDLAGLAKAEALCRRHRDLELGLADASMVVLADSWSTHALASFDERHFRAVLSLDGQSFTLLPADL